MRRLFLVLMFPTVAKAKDQCQLARNETQVWCRSVSREKKQYFLTFGQPLNFFPTFFCCLLTQPLSRLAFQYEFLFNHLFPLFFRNIYVCDWILHLNENFTNFIHLTFSFILSCRNITVKVLEIRYYYKMPDLFRTCLC